jgi:vitamin B12/bleomycin/antimicrobial peptide transport system ATP-binding/permease protein
VVFPFILCAPAFFAGKILLGALMQTAEAFGKVQDSLSFFVSAYTMLADWRAVIARLDGFETAIKSSAELATRKPSIEVEPSGTTDVISIEQLLVELPNGEPLVTASSFSISGGDRVLVTGPSGAGKSTLFRAIAGIWPYGNGSVTIPAHASLMMLPQRPYFPIGTLKAAIVYPAQADAFSGEQVGDTLVAVGLSKLASRLDEDAHWNRMLSLGEQQRLGLARALLHASQYLFLDEATASLDEAAEAKLYRLLAERLPATTIVSIGHRSTLTAFHTRSLGLTRKGDVFSLEARNREEMKSSLAE